MCADLAREWVLLAQVRPPVIHKFGCGPLAEGELPAPVKVFRHRLLHHFVLTLFCKLPAEPTVTQEGIRYMFMVCLPSPRRRD